MIATSAAANARADLMVTESAKILKRCYFLERELIRQQAGWLPGIAHWESKLLLPEILWEGSVLARELRRRVLELRYPERRVDLEDDAWLVRLLRRCGNAPNASAYVLALAEIIKPLVRDVYRHYQRLADGLDDGPTHYLLRHGMADLENQIPRLQNAARAAVQAFPQEAAAARAWRDAMARLLRDLPAPAFFAADPPVLDCPQFDALERNFTIARTGTRDPRFQVVAFAWPDRHTPGNPGEGMQLQIRQAVHHVNEVWAAEMAAASLYDLSPQAPHEFIEDAARWCYDEIRHCRMGYERLKAWGLGDSEIPLDAFSYDAGADLDPLIRLGIIFYFEATYIHTKKERTVIFGQMGDRLSSHDMDFDWADELIHTHYGKRWLDSFREQSGSELTLTEIKEAAAQAVARRLARATDHDKAVADAILHRLMARIAPGG